MTIQEPKYKPDKTLWRNIAIMAGAFSFVICLLIIVNYIQINRIDPVETKTIDALVSRLSQNPGDEQMREQIRTLDLLARKAYFTSQWQIRMGGYLLLIGVIMVIISVQMLLSTEKKIISIKPESKTNLMLMQKKTRAWLTGFSVVLVGITLIFAFLTYRQLGNKFTQTLADISQPSSETIDIAANSEIQESKPIENIEKSDIEKPEPEVKVEEMITSQEIPEMEESKEEVKNESIKEGSNPNIEPPKETPVNAKKTKTEGSVPQAGSSFSSSIPGFEYEIPFAEKFAQNFSSFRGPGGNGVSFQKNVPVNWNGETGENILWKTEIPMAGFNSPIIWGDRIFLTGANKTKMEVYCFDRLSGKILWTSPVENIPGSPATPPKVPDYTGYAAPTGATDGKHVYVIFANADVAAFDFDGKMVWGRNLGVPDNHYGYSSSLLVYNNKVIVQWDQRNVQKVMALSVVDGKTIWETDRDVKISWASPVIASTAQGPQLILAADPFVISYNPENGEERWRLKCLSGEVGPSVAVGGNMVFALNEYASLVGISLDGEPKVIWEDFDYLSDVPSPVATDQYLIVSTSYGIVACYNTKTGDKFWEAEFDNSIYSSPVITEGKVYLIDKKGITHIFNADNEFVSIADLSLGEGSVCTPAFSDGRIYIRGEKHLFCIGKK